MSYLVSRITREEFIKTRGAETTQSNARVALNMFDHFCQGTYGKSGEEIVLDLELVCKQDSNYDRVFKLVNNFILWLGQDHPELRINMCNQIMGKPKNHPSTVRRYVSSIRQFLEEFGQMEYSERRYKRLVKLPKVIDQELEPFIANQIREFVDTATRKRKPLYMTLKDSGMRIGEAMQIKRSDIDLESNPVKIEIRAEYTKTKQSRTTFVTRETKPFLVRLVKNLGDNDLVFTKNSNVNQSVNTEETLFARTRDRLGYTQRYSHNNRFKINLHAFRAFTATQLAEAYSEEFGHGFIGHKGYLKQYIRNKDQLAKKYLQAENYLMIYESVEVVDSSEKVKELEGEILKTQQLQQELLRALSLVDSGHAKLKKSPDGELHVTLLPAT
jgi:integrase